MDKKFTEEKLIEILSSSKAMPEKHWQEMTEEKLKVISNNNVTEKNFSRNQNLITLFINLFDMTKKKKLLIAGAGLMMTFMVVSALSVGAFVLYKQSEKESKIQPLSLSASEEKEILTQIVKNNSSRNLNPTANSQVTLETADAKQAANSASGTSLLYNPQDLGYKYRYSESRVDNGPAVDKCKIVGSLGEGVTENYEYFGEDETYFKWIQKNNDGSIASVNISKNSNNSYENIDYKGGKYAVKTKYEMSDNINTFQEDSSAPEDLASSEVPNEEESLDEVIKNYFGPDVKIEGKVTENGKEYYLIDYSYKIDCSQDPNDITARSFMVDDKNLPDTLITRSKFNVENFEIASTSVYINTASDENLLSTYSTKYESSNVDFAAVSDKFEFDFDVELRTVEIPTYEYDSSKEMENLVSALSEDEYELLFPTGYVLSYMTTYKVIDEPSYYDYYADRDFYAEGEAGQREFEMYNSAGIFESANPLFNLNFASLDNPNRSIYMTMYGKDTSKDEVLKSNALSGNDGVEVEIQKQKLIINGKEYQVEKYIVKSDYTIYENSESIGGETSEYKYVTFYLETESAKYTIVTSEYDSNEVLDSATFNQGQFDLDGMTIEIKRSKNDLEFIKQELERIFLTINSIEPYEGI